MGATDQRDAARFPQREARWATFAGMGAEDSQPTPSSGRALIGGGVGLIVFAGFASVALISGGYDPMSWRSALGPLVAILGVPVGIVLLIMGIVKIRRGLR